MDATNHDRDLAAGLARLEAISEQLDHEALAALIELEHGEKATEQPWLIAGISDGIGLYTAIAALDAGLLRDGLGVYWEPPHFLELDAEGAPVSPVHYARYQNALALQAYAERAGARIEVLSADVIMAPKRDLKGQAKGEPGRFPEEVRKAFEAVRARTQRPDAVVINSVAFGKWISPREGHDAIAVPSVDFEGRLVEMRTKAFHARGYEETLDTMGRNHGLWLEAAREFGWLGPDALTVFFTWAGGSQSVDVLEGIYGKGALGDAKVIAERDVAAFRLAHGLELGAHAIVRLPAFLSAALMGIPGGGLFGLVSRHLLEQEGHFDDMATLATDTLRRLFGPEWIRENPVSQIELDHAELLFIDAIRERLAEATARIEAWWEERGPQARSEPIPLEQSQKLLQGLAPPNYPTILARFRPGLAVEEQPALADAPSEAEESAITLDFELGTGELGTGGQAPRPDLTLVAALHRIRERVGARREEGPLVLTAEEVLIERSLPDDDEPLRGRLAIHSEDHGFVVTREFRDAEGNTIAAGRATFHAGTRGEEEVKVAGEARGEAIGYPMPVREPLEGVYGERDDLLRAVLEGPALVAFAARNLRERGVLADDAAPYLWTMRFGASVRVGDRLATYARRDGDSIAVTVVNERDELLLQMRVK